MFLTDWLRNRTARPAARRAGVPSGTRFRPRVEGLEGRALPAVYYAATAADLIADIAAATKAGGASTINLTAPATSPYTFAAANNTKYGSTVLPVIAKGTNLTVQTANGTIPAGYGDALDAAGHGRLFAVAPGGSLTLRNVTLRNGTVVGTHNNPPAAGGAVYNLGALDLSGVWATGNTVVGFGDAAGGAVWSSGALTVEAQTTIAANAARAGFAGIGNAFGGGVYIAGGTAALTNSTVGDGANDPPNSGGRNVAEGGDNGGSGYGGGVYVAGGTVTVSGGSLKGNLAVGGVSQTGIPSGGSGYGGGVCVAGGSVTISGAGLSYNQAAAGLPTSGFAYGYGGGVYAAAGSVTLTNDTITSNQAGGPFSVQGGNYNGDGYGGGIYIAPAAAVSLDGPTLASTSGNRDSWASGSTANIDGSYTLLP